MPSNLLLMLDKAKDFHATLYYHAAQWWLADEDAQEQMMAVDDELKAVVDWFSLDSDEQQRQLRRQKPDADTVAARVSFMRQGVQTGTIEIV